mgnify:FL=1
MDINVCLEEVILDDSPVYVVYPEDEIYSEVVGVAESMEEAWRDFASSFNRMCYNDNGAPIFIEA